MLHNLAHNLQHNLSLQSRTQSATQSLTYRQQLITHLHKYLQQHIPVLSIIDRYLTKYIDYIIEEMHKTYTQQKHKFYTEHYYYDIRNNRKHWGRVSINKKQVWMSDLVLPILMKRIYEGHNGISSGYEMRKIVIDAVEEYSFNMMPLPKPVTSNNYVDTKINRKSLEQFIANKEISVVERTQAKKILVNTDMHDMFRQAIKTPVENRIYLLGTNLQQVKKSVRAAALSGQWSYDVNCAVFAIFCSIAHELNSKPYLAVLRYINDRHTLRQQIANQTGLTVDQVKETLIAVGFGKQARNANNLAVLMTSPIAKEIIKEFRSASSVVYKHFNDTQTKSKCLANLFFTWETELMNEFVFQSRQNSNLNIHDCVIMLNKIDIAQVLCRMSVSFTTHMEYFNFEEKQI